MARKHTFEIGDTVRRSDTNRLLRSRGKPNYNTGDIFVVQDIYSNSVSDIHGNMHRKDRIHLVKSASKPNKETASGNITKNNIYNIAYRTYILGTHNPNKYVISTSEKELIRNEVDRLLTKYKEQ
jgi:hypothetical protein